MKVPLQISFRDIEPDEVIEKLIQRRTARLERRCDYLSSCRVVVERESRRHREGNAYHVRIDLTVPPSHELVVSKDPARTEKQDNLLLVIGRAFDAAQKQLKELVQKQRKGVKRHPEQDVQGIVVRLFHGQGFGFLRDRHGRELYFHQNSMEPSEWKRIEIGTGVNFFER